MPGLSELAANLAAGHATSEGLVEDCLSRIEDASGEGRRAFTLVDASGARAAARAMDALRAAHAEPSPYAGIPVSVKDLFDVRAQPTRAGSRVLGDDVATRDATAVARLRSAGLIVIGRTNMTEFAFSGLGINPHCGTPANPWDRKGRRIPGGSSSGAAVSVSDGMAYAGLGTDTGGSCRIPAALCGLVGFKPTQARVPRDGMVPLSPTLDAVGTIGRSVSCCAILDALLSGDELPSPPAETAAPRLCVVRNYMFDEIEPQVAMTFERAVQRLRGCGADVIDLELPELRTIANMNAGGGFAAAESFAWHEQLIATSGTAYDPRVLVRIQRGQHQTARDLLALHADRAALIDGVRRRVERFDAFICPTVPLVAPRLDALDDDDEYSRINLLMLRNPTVVNLLDGCAASVPMHAPDDPPAGLMVAGMAGQDAAVLQVAAWIEASLCPN